MYFREGVYTVRINCKPKPIVLEGGFSDVAVKFVAETAHISGGYTVFGGKQHKNEGSEIPTLIQPVIEKITIQEMEAKAEIDPVVKAELSLARMLGMLNQ